MLDNGADGLVEFLGQLPSRLKVDDVVIGKFLALNLAPIGHAAAGPVRVHGSLLMGILAVAQVHYFVERQSQVLRESGFRVEFKMAIGAYALKRGGDSRIVRRGSGESFLSQAPLGGR